ncbi:MAG: GUN4 domain-containing protein [Lyngbya sp.]|nr:GUN4 domain-containing protein [Lyngbya sp.]
MIWNHLFMSYCINPECLHPVNPDTAKFCQSCGEHLLLQNRYRPIQPLGEGGFGKTYLAVDEQIPSKPPCAIKQFVFGDRQVNRYSKAAKLFRQEAVRLEQLGEHPQIPQLLAHFEQNQQLFLVEEYIAGKTLEQEFEQKGTFNEAQIWDLLRGLLPVLKYIHDRQIVHRDIKPANILRRSPLSGEGEIGAFEAIEPIVSRSALSKTSLSSVSVSSPPLRRKEQQWVLIDFGVAKLLSETAINQTGTVVGSPEFMAPEQTRGKAFAASDLYGLGASCLYLLTGVSPWQLYDEDKQCWVWREFLTSQHRVSERLGRILDGLVAFKLEERYASADIVLQAINTPKVSTSTGLTPVKRSPSRSRSSESLSLSGWRLPDIFTQFLPALSPLNDELDSAVGVDYTKLQRLLATHQWKAADEETWSVLGQALGYQSFCYLHPQELKKLPCQDLRTIDRLWVKYSQGRFGFSVQTRIYEEVEGDYALFCDRLGWLTYNPHHPSVGFRFDRSAPIGHLPSRLGIVGSGQWWRHAQMMSERIVDCGIV